jgi:hypothetical protein
LREEIAGETSQPRFLLKISTEKLTAVQEQHHLLFVEQMIGVHPEEESEDRYRQYR